MLLKHRNRELKGGKKKNALPAPVCYVCFLQHRDGALEAHWKNNVIGCKTCKQPLEWSAAR